MKQILKQRQILDALDFMKWVLYACGVGVVVGLVAIVFHEGIDWATHLRGEYPKLIYGLPLGGIAIVWMYRICGMEKDRGTNLVLVAVREGKQMKLRTSPLIFTSTILTHLVGGSAGREGAALQLGGSLGAYMGRRMGMNEKDHQIMVICGMSAAFSGLFGTPLTAAVFSMEVVSVGVMYYSAIVSSLVASLVSYQLAKAAGLHAHHGYEIGRMAPLTPSSMLQVVILGLLCALVSIVFCKAMHIAPKVYGKYLKNPMIRAAVGGVLVLALTMLLGSQDYNGAGDPVIRRMLVGETIPSAFIWKILFTALTLGAGFRGGEIVPVLFTGCAFGTLIGPMLGLPHGFSGSLGMAAVFCGATNCPLSAILLSYELFGGESLPLYALCCAVAYALSGYYGLYSEQQIVFAKARHERIDKQAH